MGIDRWLIVGMPVDGRRKFAIALPRPVLALLPGTLIFTLLVLRIFQLVINAQFARMQQQSYNTFLRQQQATDLAEQVGTYSSELQYLNNVIATRGATTANTASDPELKGYSKHLANLNNKLARWISLKSQYCNDDYICQIHREEGWPGSEDDAWYDNAAVGIRGGQGSASAVLPGTGGAQLSWDDDE